MHDNIRIASKLANNIMFKVQSGDYIMFGDEPVRLCRKRKY